MQAKDKQTKLSLQQKLFHRELLTKLQLSQEQSSIYFAKEQDSLQHLTQIYHLAEKHIIKQMDINQAHNFNKDEIIQAINWQTEFISFFLFYKQRVEIKMPFSLFYQKAESIIDFLLALDNDIIFYTEDYHDGFCILKDEYQVTFSRWNKS